MSLPTVRIDEDRLWQSLMTMAEIGATPGGGVCRIALTDVDREARDLFSTWCSDAGLDLRIEALIAHPGGTVEVAALADAMSRQDLDMRHAVLQAKDRLVLQSENDENDPRRFTAAGCSVGGVHYRANPPRSKPLAASMRRAAWCDRWRGSRAARP